MNPLSVFVLLVGVVAMSKAQVAIAPASSTVAVNPAEVVIAGPSGSIRTNNGLGRVITDNIRPQGSVALYVQRNNNVLPNINNIPVNTILTNPTRTVYPSPNIIPTILADPRISSLGLGVPAFAPRPIIANPGIAPAVLAASGISPIVPNILAAQQLGLNLNSLGLGINGLGLQAF